MSDDELDHLERRKTEIHRNYGFWASPALAWSSADAAGVPPCSGDTEAVHRVSQSFSDAAKPLFDAQEALADVRALNVDGVWTGAAHHKASEALAALSDDVLRAYLSYRGIADHLRVYGERLAPVLRSDESGRAELRRASAEADKLTAGPIPDPFGYDGEAMRAAHHLAMAGVDARVAAHREARDNGRDFAAAMHDIAGQARGRKLRAGSLTALDDVILAGAGGIGSAILTPAMEQRASAAFEALDRWDRNRMMTLLTAAASPEHRAYLLKALAAGYSVSDVSRFDALIAAHGTDPTWLDQHLSPLAMDGNGGTSYKIDNTFYGTEWDQGELPTCVAASTVAGRAEVDPLYALQLTTGGHPDDPAFDNPHEFLDRLRAEQDRVYDGGRSWWDKVTHTTGMSDNQSAAIANEEIAPHTGVSYDNVEMQSRQAREDMLPSVERAVDDGYPVPLVVWEGDKGHQMLIIGHSADGHLQIYNPWGYTYWVTEDEFTTGHVDGIDSDIPSTPTSVRLPQQANR